MPSYHIKIGAMIVRVPDRPGCSQADLRAMARQRLRRWLSMDCPHDADICYTHPPAVSRITKHQNAKIKELEIDMLKDDDE